MRWLIACILYLGTLSHVSSYAENLIRIGVQAPLTGSAASFGQDIVNGIKFALRGLENRYTLIIEDDKCDATTAVTVAQKLINVSKVRFILGIACNATLLATASLYHRAGITVIAATSSGDTHDLGENNFRLLPSDLLGAHALFELISANKHKTLGIITETSAYTELLERTMRRYALKDSAIRIITEQFPPEVIDFRSLILKQQSHGVDSIFINTDTEISFIALLRQIKALHLNVPLYGMYWPGSPTVRRKHSSHLEEMHYVDLPSPRVLNKYEGSSIMEEIAHAYGAPQSFEIAAAVGYESLRILDAAIMSSRPIAQFLHDSKFEGGPLGHYHFNADGEIEGITFEKKVIRKGMPSSLK